MSEQIPEQEDVDVTVPPANLPAAGEPVRDLPATSDPEQMVDTPDELGGTGGVDAGGAG